MDYRRVAASLRRKAADPAVTPEEAAALTAKADELDAKYNFNSAPINEQKEYAAPVFHHPWVQDGYAVFVYKRDAYGYTEYVEDGWGTDDEDAGYENY